MAVNLLEEDRLVYHDEDGDTLIIKIPSSRSLESLYFHNETGGNEEAVMVDVNRDAVETLRDSLTTWLETGKLK